MKLMNPLKSVVASLALAASAAQAQTTTTTTATAPAVAPAAQTSTASAPAAAPAEKSPWGLNVIFEFGVSAQDLKEKNSEAMVDSWNAIGLKYKVSSKYNMELRHNYGLRIISDSEQLKQEIAKETFQKPVKDENGQQKVDKDNKPVTEKVESKVYDYGSNPYIAYDPTIHFNVNTDISLLGSKPLAIASRYYIPMTKESVLNNSLGVLRTGTSLAWDLTTKVSLSLDGQVRLYMNRGGASDESRARGADSELRYIVGPNLGYNFSDTLNVYYNPYLDLKTTGHQRGDFAKAEITNTLVQDIGLSWTIGEYTINPYWETTAKRTADSVAYVGYGKDENSSYGLFLQAVY